jgi:hypothetical protein
MLATPRDIQASVSVIAVFGLFSIIGIPKPLLNAVLSSPIVSRIIWIGSVLFLLSYKYYLTAVLVALVGLNFSFNVRSSYVFSSEGIMEMYRAAQSDDPRFDQQNEIDLKMAEGTLMFDPARWRDPGRAPVPLLLFPPTPDQLKLIGSS